MRKIYEKYRCLPVRMKAAFWFTICNVLQKGILYLAVPIYTRILTTEQYGSYTVFLSWLEIFEILATFRIAWGGYAVGLTKYERDRDAYTSSLQCLSILITTICMIIYLIFFEVINRLTGMTLQMTLMMFGILYAIPAIQFWTVRQRVENRYVSVVLVTALTSIFTILIGSMAAIRFDQKDMAVIGGRLIAQGSVACILVWVNCHKNFVFFRAEYWKRTIRFNVPLLPYYFSMVVLHSSDKIIIKSLVGQAQAGIYSVAYTTSVCMQLFSTSINQAIQPWIYEKLKKRQLDGIKQVTNATLLLVAGLNLILVALAPEVVAILAPPQYQEAIWVIPPLAANVVVIFGYQQFVNVQFFFEESRLTAIASVGAALLNVVLNYALIPVFGYYAAGYTTLVSYIFFGIAHYCFMRVVCHKHHISPDFINIKVMFFILAGFLGCVAVLLVGYFVTPIRYIFILAVIGVGIVKRKLFISLVRELMIRKKC